MNIKVDLNNFYDLVESVADTSSIIVTVNHHEAHIIYATTPFVDMFGYSRTALMQQSVSILYPRDYVNDENVVAFNSAVCKVQTATIRVMLYNASGMQYLCDITPTMHLRLVEWLHRVYTTDIDGEQHTNGIDNIHIRWPEASKSTVADDD
jgi:hypothetical protein